MEAHALTARLLHPLPPPFLVLLISGGHCLLSLCSDIDRFFLLGQTWDNSPGEALDKIARRLKLHNRPDLRDVSGGRAVELAGMEGEAGSLEFSVSMRSYRDCNFSFSGLKASLETYVGRSERDLGLDVDQLLPNIGGTDKVVHFLLYLPS